jgi:hypothetical protein
MATVMLKPMDLLVQKNCVKRRFFSFFLSGTPPLETITISGGDDTGIYLMDFKPAKRKAGSDTCLSLSDSQ